MSSRAASGRKRLRPAQTASPSLSTLPESIQPANALHRIDVGSRTQYASPQPLQAHIPMSAPSPSPSTLSSSSGFPSPRQSPRQSQSSRDQMQRREAAAGITPYPPPSQFYQPPPMRKERVVHFHAANPAPESPALHPAPSYSTLSSNFSSDSESGSGSQRSSAPRALPPYPSPPSSNTGWAALSDAKIASAIAVPPRYPESEDGHQQMDPYPSPPPSLDSQITIARTESVASSSRLPLAAERPERASSDSQPPHYSPPSSPRLIPTHLKVPTAPGTDSPLQPNRSPASYSNDPAYSTPQASSLSSPSTSLASLPSTSSGPLHRRGSSLSGSSDSTSGGMLAYAARTRNPARESTQSVSTSSSGRSVRSAKSDTSPTALSAPTSTSSSSPTTPFVFPSSRSRARPSNPTPVVSGFKFSGRRKLKAQMANVQVLAPGTPIPAEGIFTAQPVPHPPPPQTTFQPTSPPPQNLRLAPTVSIGSSSSASSGAPATPTFYFPSARTRAHPKAPTQFALGKATKPNFLKLGLRSKKGAALPSAPVAGPSVPPVPQPDEPLSPMQGTPSMLPPEDDERYVTQMSEPRGSYEDFDPYDPNNRDSMIVRPPSPQVVTKIGTYPLDAYDAGLIEIDRQTWELLRKMNPTNTPSFHNYGGRPPHTVLDLGCGSGHWMLDAAMAWRNSGTQIVGFDMVDTTKAIWPVAQRQGITNNVKFVRGNFLKQPLPFPDGSFQLVRMANLALCIPHEKWEFVLDQVWRVLAVGGRLEFIDDHVFFPYGKPPQLNPRPQSPPAPMLDTMIPSTVFSRMSLADVVNPNPNVIRETDADSQIYDLYGVEEEEEYSDADTVASGRRLGTATPHTRPSSRTSSRSASLYGAPGDPEAWREQAAAARELEGLFEHMMNVKFGIHLHPSEFVGEMLMRIFGGVKEMTAMHLTLAPPETEVQVRSASVNGRPKSGRFERAQAAGGADDTLGHCPGLILWPSTFIPMALPELESHVGKHLRVLLSCKSALIDYAAEIADQDEGDTQSEAAMEALWEYQNFLRERFNPPPDDSSRAMSDASSDANSIHNSIFSVSSVGTEAFDAMREYQSELKTRFEVPPSEHVRPPRTPVRDAPKPTSTPPPQRNSLAESSTSGASSSSSGSSSASNPNPNPDRPRKSRSRGSRGRDRSSVISVVPPYSRIELTHVRTFYVYEAVKQAQDRFQIGMF